MLTPYSQSQFVEKIIADASGRQFRVIFLVALVNGEIRGRIVSVQPISQNILSLEGAVSDGSFTLPSWTHNEVIETPYFRAPAPFVSPYFDIETILNSQPTRAPSIS